MDDLPEVDSWRNPNLTLTEKFNRHIDRKRKSGVLSSASKLNAVIPWFFFFVYLGGSGWIVMAAAPYHYQRDAIRLFLVEIFTVYVFIQVIINWLFTCYITSPYIADTENAKLHTTGVHSDPSCESTLSAPPCTQMNSNSAPEEDKRRTGLAYRVMVVTSVSGNQPQRESMPYWSWVPCYVCQRARPPRCHHCTLCNHCVLKRDHHCYFARNCIGVKNQRYFIYFLVWCVVLCSIGCFQLIPFIFQDILPKYSYADLLFPFNMYRVMVGQLPFLYCHLIIVTWGVLSLTFISCGMCGTSIYHVVKGLTSFESKASIKIIDTRSVSERLRSVMGQNWAVGLFIPGAASFSFMTPIIPTALSPSEPVEDPVTWPSIKP